MGAIGGLVVAVIQTMFSLGHHYDQLCGCGERTYLSSHLPAYCQLSFSEVGAGERSYIVKGATLWR